MAKTRSTFRPSNLVPIDGSIPPDPNLQAPRSRTFIVRHPDPQHPSNLATSGPRHVSPSPSPQASPRRSGTPSRPRQASPSRSATPPRPRQASPAPRSATPTRPRQASPAPRHVTPPPRPRNRNPPLPRQASPPRNRNPALPRRAPPRHVNPPRPPQVPRGHAGGIRQPGRKPRRGENALREIRKHQKSTDLLIKTSPFIRLVREIAFTYKTDIRFQKFAITALQEAAESFYVQFFEAAYMCTVHAKRVTLMNRDLFLAQRVSSYNTSFNPKTQGS